MATVHRRLCRRQLRAERALGTAQRGTRRAAAKSVEKWAPGKSLANLMYTSAPPAHLHTRSSSYGTCVVKRRAGAEVYIKFASWGTNWLPTPVAHTGVGFSSSPPTKEVVESELRTAASSQWSGEREESESEAAARVQENSSQGQLTRGCSCCSVLQLLSFLPPYSTQVAPLSPLTIRIAPSSLQLASLESHSTP